MKNKFWPILIIVFSSVMLISIIPLAFIQNNSSLDLPNPDSIIIYDKSQIPIESFSPNDEAYNEIISAYNNMSQKSLLQQLSSGHIISNNITEGTNKSLWLDSNKESGIWIEFAYNNPKKMVITINNNTRQIDTKGIIFQLSHKDQFSNCLIYFGLVVLFLEVTSIPALIILLFHFFK